MKLVLFICVHNSGRSQMAEAFFNHLAKTDMRAISAGTQPSEKINPLVVKVMNEIGLDISNNKPKMLTAEMINNAHKIITMGCGAEAKTMCPSKFIASEDWALQDPEGKSIDEIRLIRNQIKERVLSLIKEMECNR